MGKIIVLERGKSKVNDNWFELFYCIFAFGQDLYDMTLNGADVKTLRRVLNFNLTADKFPIHNSQLY